MVMHFITYFLILHFRLASMYFSQQLTDMFGYELPISQSSKIVPTPQHTKQQPPTMGLTLVYTFHSLLVHSRIFIFSLSTPLLASAKSVSELFPNASWLEREIAELYGFFFEGKKDTRNLMLQYGEVFFPFQKYYPVTGLKELFYLILFDIFKQFRFSLQV